MDPKTGSPHARRGVSLERLVALTLVAASSVAAARCGPPHQDGTLERNKQLVLRRNDQVWNRANLDAMEEFYTPDFVLHFLPDGSETRGIERQREHVREHRESFPDWSEDIQRIVAEGDLVVIHYVSSGTQEGEWQGRPPTGRRVRLHEVSIFRIEAGRIAEQWLLPDVAGMERQLAGTGGDGGPTDRFSYSRISSDPGGDSHFSSATLELTPVDPGPGIPPTPASAPVPATALRVLCPTVGGEAGWHPVPARVLNVMLSGTVAIEVSDGETRTFGAGDVILGEDTAGTGHRTTVVGTEPACFAMVVLRDG